MQMESTVCDKRLDVRRKWQEVTLKRDEADSITTRKRRYRGKYKNNVSDM